MSDFIELYLLLSPTAESDLVDVLAVIRDLNDWKVLGLQLGLLYSTLERINLEQNGIINNCKIKMLSAWLQQQDNVSQNGVPSWSVLRAALKQMGMRQLTGSAATDGEYIISYNRVIIICVHGVGYH